MQFTTSNLAFLALALTSTVTAMPRGLLQPIFSCDTTADPVGGCCESFPTGGGFGTDCKKATEISDGQFTCSNKSTDIGQPGCCNAFVTCPAGTECPIPVLCVAA